MKVQIKTTFLITNERSPNVLGRDILGKLQLNWQDIFDWFAAFEVSSNSEIFAYLVLIPCLKRFTLISRFPVLSELPVASDVRINPELDLCKKFRKLRWLKKLRCGIIEKTL